MAWPPNIAKLPMILSDVFRDIITRIDANYLVDSKTIRITRDAHGTSANVWGSNGGIGGSADKPLLVVKKVGDEWFAGVAFDYFLSQPIVAASTPVELSVSGKLTSANPSSDDAGFNPTFENDFVWIEVTVTDFEATSAYVGSYGRSDEWGGGEMENDGVPVDDGTAQTKCRVVLGRIVADGENLVAVPMAAKAHRLGAGRADSADSGGGNHIILDGLLPYAL